jgi:hypothetical protein
MCECERINVAPDTTAECSEMITFDIVVEPLGKPIITSNTEMILC